MSRMVTVVTCQTASEAAMTCHQLAQAGIEIAVVDGEGIIALPGTPGPIKVQVPVRQVTQALDLLREGTGPQGKSGSY